VLTTDEAVVAADLPASVLVMGGGPIGCEFATIYVELGIRTHLVEMQPALLPGLDADAGKLVARLLAERGADVRVGAKIVSMADTGDGLAVGFDDGGQLRVDAVLVAVGRLPNVEDIGLGAVGIELAERVIPVEEHCRTRAEGIYAIGDVAERRQYAHLADRMGVVAGDNAMGVPAADDRTVVPVGVYTHPEVAAVGLTLEQAKQRSAGARAFRYSYSASSTGLAYGETDGMLKVIADADSGTLHGATWIGPHAIDMIQEFALAMRHGLTMGQLHETIHAHPTFQEAAGGVAAAWAAAAMRKRA
jgi:dihydrolipoamide dehydrogenase